MAQEPDRIRQEIDRTRAELTHDVDRLAQKTHPKRVAQRRWTAVKEKVMGTAKTASQFGDKAGNAAHEMADSVRHTPNSVVRQAEGNPVAAGVIAFGVGMLAATLVPATDAEKRAGQQLRDNLGDIPEQARETARELGDEVAGTVQQGAQQVRQTAQDAARATRDEARASIQDAVKQTTQAAHRA